MHFKFGQNLIDIIRRKDSNALIKHYIKRFYQYLYLYSKNKRYNIENKIFKYQPKFKLKNAEYDCIIPIGRSCHTAMHLNNVGLRQFSYPMDWIIPCCNVEFLETRMEYLINGFENFLRIEDLVLINPKRPHQAVQNEYSGFCFFHDFESEKELKDSYPPVFEKYSRRIERVMKHIQNSQKILLIYMSATWDHMDEIGIHIHPNQLKTMSRRLSKVYPTVDFDFLIFEHDEKMLPFDYSVQRIGDNIIKYFSNHTYTKNNEKLGTILSIENVLLNISLSNKFNEKIENEDTAEQLL